MYSNNRHADLCSERNGISDRGRRSHFLLARSNGAVCYVNNVTTNKFNRSVNLIIIGTSRLFSLSFAIGVIRLLCYID